MNSPTIDNSLAIHEVGQLFEEAIVATFDDGFEAGAADQDRAPLVTPNPYPPHTVLHVVWALGYEHGSL